MWVGWGQVRTARLLHFAAARRLAAPRDCFLAGPEPRLHEAVFDGGDFSDAEFTGNVSFSGAEFTRYETVYFTPQSSPAVGLASTVPPSAVVASTFGKPSSAMSVPAARPAMPTPGSPTRELISEHPFTSAIAFPQDLSAS